MNNKLLSAWNQSYDRNENHLFYPSEEVIKFVSRNIVKRKHIDTKKSSRNNNKIVCVACGIGRHVKFCYEMGLDSFGCDLSENAVKKAKSFLTHYYSDYDDSKIICSSVENLPWNDSYFNYAISDSALDSMPTDIAKKGILEIYRILKPNGLFYCSLISPLGSDLDINFDGEITIDTDFEKGTIQSFFNYEKIKKLLEPQFKIISCELSTKILPNGAYNGESRWHIISKKTN